MTRNKFLKELENALGQLPAPERNDILEDFEEHFEIGFADGKTEDEIATSLGSPTQIAKEMIANHHLGTAGQHATPGNILRATWAVIGLSFFNLVIVLGPFIGLVGIMIGGWIASGAFVLSPLLLVLSLLTNQGNSYFEFFVSIVLCGIGLLLGLVMYQLTKWLSSGFIRYLKFNMSLVKGGIKHETN